jgi:cob(I)alamin adenosyltransferase
MIAAMKIYTRTGDDGTTGLIGGGRVSKGDPRIECYGTVDELNAVLGLVAVAADAELRGWVREVQSALFAIGAYLAAPAGTPAEQAHVADATDRARTDRLEQQIDDAQATLPVLRNFILPGGTELAARLHHARTVCRRAERLLVGFAYADRVAPEILTYFNRLSDWLFVQARRANHLAGEADIPWVKG